MGFGALGEKLGKVFHSKGSKLKAHDAKHEGKGLIEHQDYKEGLEKINKDKNGMTTEDYDAAVKKLQTDMGKDGKYFHSAEYDAGKADIEGKTHGIEKVATHWGTTLALGAAPVVLSLNSGGGDKSDSGSNDNSNNDPPPAYSPSTVPQYSQ
jgi:hypothetical protein